MARACGAHQGAGVTSAGFEASGNLKAANEERDDDEDEDELVATASRVSDDARTTRGSVCARKLAL